MDRVIIVETNDQLREELTTSLAGEGYDVVACTAEKAAERLRAGADAVVLGRVDPPCSMLTILAELKALDRIAPVVVVATSPEECAEALKVGAFYVSRLPVSADELALLTSRALKSTTRLRRSRARAVPGSLPMEEPTLLGETSAMRGVRDAMRRLRGSPASALLVLGESGTGKTTLARAVHFESGRGGSFVHANLSALPEGLLEGELFGVEPSLVLPQGQVGLLERADGGTLYFDELADMPLSLQAKFLRFLEGNGFRRVGSSSDRVSEPRVIAASRRDLKAEVKRGTLLPQLLARLCATTIELPPLRHRLPDIPLLVQHFLGVLSRRLDRPLRGVTTSTLRLLTSHDWPGNVRELANLLERAALLSEGDLLEIDRVTIQSGHPLSVNYRLPLQGIDYVELEREVVTQALRYTHGNQTRAATLLGMTRDQIRYRIAKFGMNPSGQRASVDGIHVN